MFNFQFLILTKNKMQTKKSKSQVSKIVAIVLIIVAIGLIAALLLQGTLLQGSLFRFDRSVETQLRQQKAFELLQEPSSRVPSLSDADPECEPGMPGCSDEPPPPPPDCSTEECNINFPIRDSQTVSDPVLIDETNIVPMKESGSFQRL